MLSGSHHLSKPQARTVGLWMAMAFQAGAVNAGGFLACKRFVTHTTGFATAFGTELSQKNISEAVSMAIVPIFFILGAAISAYFIDRKLARNEKPNYEFLFSAIPCLLLIITGLGAKNVFGSFGGDWSERAGLEFILLALLSLTMGVQNASITSASGATVRTTHLTGISTDLGIGLVRIFSSAFDNDVKYYERRATLVRCGLVISFILGSTIGAFVFLQFQFLGFLLPTITAVLILSLGVYLRRTRKGPT